MKNWLKENRKLILFCLFISLVSLLPYLIGGLNEAHDNVFHLSRIEGFARSIMDGDLFPRIYPYKNNGYGYGSPMFYSDYLLLLPSLLYCLGVPVVICYKFTLFLFSFISALTTAFFIKRISKQTLSPYLAAALYVFSTYRLTDMYVRGSLGEIMAFAFLPLVLWSAYEIIHGNYKQYALPIIAFTGLVLTHNISFALGCILFGALLLINIKQLFNEPKRIFGIIIPVVVVIGITAFFTFPMLEQLSAQDLYVHHIAENSSFETTGLAIQQYFGFTVQYLEGIGNLPFNCLNIGYLLMFLPITSFFTIKKHMEPTSKYVLQLTILGYIFLIMCSDIFPWSAFSFMSIIQFAWRFLGLAMTCLIVPASICPIGLVKSINQKKVSIILTSITILFGIICTVPVYGQLGFAKNNDKYTDIISIAHIPDRKTPEVEAGEYLPYIYFNLTTAQQCVFNRDDTVVTCDVTSDKTTKIASVQNIPGEFVVFPAIWYKGYTAVLDTGTETYPTSVMLSPETGLCLVYVGNPDFVGKIVLNYTGTRIQKLSLLVSIGTCFLLLGWWIWDLRKRKSTSTHPQLKN